MVVGGSVRHESSSQSLEEQRNGTGKAGKKGPDSAEKREEAEEERAGGEEEGDELEGKHEAREIVELVCPVGLVSYGHYPI